ncbi:MAG: amidase [Actinobacteria bacterium]|nr:amidase [Actinomycetota bacterium]
MTSVATSAFAWALEHLRGWQSDDVERRPAFDVWPGEHIAPVDGSPVAEAPLGGAIGTARARLDTGETSAAELVEQSLAAIDADSDRLVAFVEVQAAAAREQAARLDAELKRGSIRGPMHGIPISVKDVIHVAGATTRCGSLAYENHPGHDAWAVERLREAGAIVLGKVATHEFALGVTSPQSRNPRDETRIPGGSSGGSAVAVATGMGLASVCTDTRASSRVPAALSGVVGLKATYGTIPTAGVVPLSWTMDHVGMIAGDVAGAAIVLDALRDGPRACAGRLTSVEGMRIGLPRAAWEGVDPDVERSVDTALEALTAAGATLTTVEQPGAEDFVGANAGGLVSSRCEAAAFHRALKSDRSLYWDEVRDQLDAADDVLAVDYIDAQRYRAWLREKMLDAIAGVDALVMPTSPVLAPRVELADDYLTVLSRNAILWSFVGFPAMSLPSVPAAGGLPVGLQVVAAPHAEATMIAVASAVERGLAEL